MPVPVIHCNLRKVTFPNAGDGSLPLACLIACPSASAGACHCNSYSRVVHAMYFGIRLLRLPTIPSARRMRACIPSDWSCFSPLGFSILKPTLCRLASSNGHLVHQLDALTIRFLPVLDKKTVLAESGYCDLPRIHQVYPRPGSSGRHARF